MKPLLLVYITARDLDQARLIARTLVTEKLAACANIIPAVNSLYFWEGTLCDDSEAAIVCKTRQELLDRLVKRTKALHTYAVPCIVALPIVGGNSAFLDWVRGETKKAPEKRTGTKAARKK